ncbi:MAG: T9SS type A sorting domain-containing protein [Janthinobacterium lividum]
MKLHFTYYLAWLAVLFCGLLAAPAQAQVLKGTLAMGYNHSLSIHADGTLWATGGNEYGQLGDGTATDRSAWVQVGTATNWVQATIGSQTSLALRTDGSLWGWGNNQYGQLATSTNLNTSLPNPTPVQIPGTYVQVACSGTHVLALRADGSLWAWGFNLYGQLGNSPVPANGYVNPVPAQVAGTYTQVAASSDGSMALKADGSLWTWGDNYFGQLGIAATAGTSGAHPVPTQVPGTYTQMSAGLRYSLALRADGSLWAWGVNNYGQLGNATNLGTTTPNPVPTQVAGTYTRLQASVMHSLALSASGTLYAWGSNSSGQLATTVNVGTSTYIPTPTAIAGTFVQMASGTYGSLALWADGTLLGWGYNFAGQLGTSTGATPGSTPLLPTATGTALPTRSTAAGYSTGYAIKSDGTLWSWGENSHGELGNGITTSRTRPGQVGTDHDWVQVVAGYSHALALKANGTVWTWGTNIGGTAGGSTAASLLTPMKVNMPPATSIAAGDHHDLALTASGSAYAWGLNNFGELGIGTTANSAVPPTAVAGNLTLTQLSAGQSYSLGLTATGTLYAWGDNSYGQLGIVAGSGSTGPNPTPMPVPNLAGIVKVAAGDRHALGVTATGVVYAWGGNLYGQLGVPVGPGGVYTSAVPTLIAGLSGLRQVGAYAQHNLALLANGTIYSWGLNQWGALGQGTFSTTLVTVPAQEVTLNGDWAQLGTGSTATASLVRTASGLNFASAGLNTAGQLGDGTTTNWPRFDRLSPLVSLQPLPVLAATVGVGFSLAPNPTRSQATAVGVPTGTTLAVYDALGRLIMTTGNLTFSVAGLPAGLYVVRATAPGQAPQSARLLVE